MDDSADQSEQPVLSVVVAIVCDTLRSRADASYLEKTLEALSRQAGAPPMEILVPHSAHIRGLEQIQARFPEVRFLKVTELASYHPDARGRDHHDELRAVGIAAARGEIVALTEDHGRPDGRWCARIVQAYRDGYAGVGGAIENGVDRLVNWAVYFCDFGAYQNPVSPGPTAMISDANASYRREALEAIREVWQKSFHQVVVNRAILERGGKLGIFPDIVVYQHRDGLGLGEALAERYVWGRSFGASRCRWISRAARVARAALAPLLPLVLVGRMAAGVARKGRLRKQFATALPLVVLLASAWSLGELAGYVSGRPCGGKW
jgi:hypothetical protein